MKKLNVRQLILVALFAALLAVLSQLSIPLPAGVPVTLQTFAIALCGFALGAKLGTLSVAVYLLMGAVGLPVFAGFVSGVGVFAGVTGGFLWGFLAMAALCGTGSVPLGVLGLLVMHLLGSLQFMLVSGMTFWQSAAIATLPFLIKDAASLALAYIAARAVRRGLAAARFSIT